MKNSVIIFLAVVIIVFVTINIINHCTIKIFEYRVVKLEVAIENDTPILKVCYADEDGCIDYLIKPYSKWSDLEKFIATLVINLDDIYVEVKQFTFKTFSKEYINYGGWQIKFDM